jgi:hypothetical protein
MIKSAAASEKFATQAIGLVRDFAAFAGRNGVRGAILAIAAAMSARRGTGVAGASAFDRDRGKRRRRTAL